MSDLAEKLKRRRGSARRANGAVLNRQRSTNVHTFNFASNYSIFKLALRGAPVDGTQANADGGFASI
ncbi:hypothetical protein [Paraburkholderia sp. BCC1885]|uniref:hypothetical protein n=1 Tax=Paraburkholderia sp. BCC1885 TaxID=2562669 RepID=UPI0011826D1A|nr:hypothetical protein [Paraburkholderia sp. BCC1885]